MDGPLLRDEEPPLIAQELVPRWSLLHRVIFRFLCAYLLLFLAGAFAQNIRNSPDIWLGVHLFHLSGQAVIVVRTGSGDTALAYVREFCAVVLAVVTALVWSVIDRKRANYR